MREVATAEAEKCLGELLEAVESGEEVVITRDGTPVARLARILPPADVARGRAAMERIREQAKTATLGGITIRELIDEGRRY